MKTGIDILDWTPDFDRLRQEFRDISDGKFWELAINCVDYSLLQIEGLYNIYNSIEYLCRNGIAGDIVECGVFKGGAMMMAAESLIHFCSFDRDIFLFDTFEWPTRPTDLDVDIDGNRAADLLNDFERRGLRFKPFVEEVKDNLRKTSYPFNRFRMVIGPVEQTLPHDGVGPIALLRLDTDFYESTYHSMVHLFPKLVRGGVLILDDYGFWKGCRKAVDQYIAENGLALLLNRIGLSIRCAIKL
jgi:hypothetical protein